MLTVALIGYGWWGGVLAKSVAGKSDKIRIHSINTRNPDALADAAAEIGAIVHRSYEDALADPAVEAVLLATPHSQHRAQIEAAAAAGKHVFVEKPLTLTAADARAAFAATEAAGLVLAVGFNRRFHPSMVRLVELSTSGALGRIVLVESTMTAPGIWMYKPGSWRQSPDEQPAGGMTGLGIHAIDAMIAATGPVARVKAEARKVVAATELQEVTTVLMELKGGGSAYLGTSIATAPYFGFRVFGTDGWAEIRNGDLSDLVVMKRGGQPETISTPAFDMQRAELEAFADAVAGIRPFPVTRDEAIHGTEVMEAVFRAAAEAGEVAIAV